MFFDFWQITTIIGVITGFTLVYLGARYLFGTIKVMAKVVLYLSQGFIFLWIVNTFGGIAGVFLPINIATLGIVSLLGIPGIVALLTIRFLVFL